MAIPTAEHARRTPRTSCRRCLNYVGMKQFLNRTAVPAGLLWGLHLDDAGVCNVCRAYERAFVPALVEKERNHALALAQRRGAIVAISGGKDSLALLHLARRTHHLDLHAFFFDSGYIADGVLRQVERVCARERVPLHVGGWRGRAATTFERHVEKGRLDQPHPCGACSAGIGEQLLALADTLRIPVVLNGSNYFARWDERVRANLRPRTPGGRTVVFSHFLYASHMRLPEVRRRVAALGATVVATGSTSSNCAVPARVHQRLGQALGHMPDLEDLSLEVMVGHRTRRSALEALMHKAPQARAFFTEVYGLAKG
jgi:NAD(P)-dependent dehydrogenase (short-subunit alcohol dehydrogenase family)